MDNNRFNIIGIIPARMGSSRFPGKPLEKILGISMIGHVYHRSKMSNLLKEVYIATCDKEIADYADSIGAKWIMTKDTHERASNRTAEAMIVPEMIDMAIKPFLEDSSVEVVNLMAPIRSVEEHHDPNCPKVVVDKNNFAIYFSREPIPSRKKWKEETVPMFKQVCVIPFTRNFLLKFNELEPTPLEIIESIDMNRVLEHGYKVKMILTDVETYSVDTPEDLVKVEKKMLGDKLIDNYVRN